MAGVRADSLGDDPHMHLSHVVDMQMDAIIRDMATAMMRAKAFSDLVQRVREDPHLDLEKAAQRHLYFDPPKRDPFASLR